MSEYLIKERIEELEKLVSLSEFDMATKKIMDFSKDFSKSREKIKETIAIKSKFSRLREEHRKYGLDRSIDNRYLELGSQILDLLYEIEDEFNTKTIYSNTNLLDNKQEQRDTKITGTFKTMLFSYRYALVYFSGFKKELDEVMESIDTLEVEIINSFYRPILEDANTLLTKIEMLDEEKIQNSEMKNFLLFLKLQLKSHNTTALLNSFDARVKSIEKKIRDFKEKEKIMIFNKLMWTKESIDVSMNDAIGYAKNLRLGGYSDWRLPTVYELSEAIHSCGGEVNSCDENINNSKYQYCYQKKRFLSRYTIDEFDFGTGTHYWSSSTLDNNPNYLSLVVCFYDGSKMGSNQTINTHYARFVRSEK